MEECTGNSTPLKTNDVCRYIKPLLSSVDVCWLCVWWRSQVQQAIAEQCWCLLTACGVCRYIKPLLSSVGVCWLCVWWCSQVQQAIAEQCWCLLTACGGACRCNKWLLNSVDVCWLHVVVRAGAISNYWAVLMSVDCVWWCVQVQ